MLLFVAWVLFATVRKGKKLVSRFQFHLRFQFQNTFLPPSSFLLQHTVISLFAVVLTYSARQVQFGYVYGFSVFGCLALQCILNLIHPTGLDFWRTCSVLGYCLLPVIGLAALGIILPLKGLLGLILSAFVIVWSTFAATR